MSSLKEDILPATPETLPEGKLDVIVPWNRLDITKDPIEDIIREGRSYAYLDEKLAFICVFQFSTSKDSEYIDRLIEILNLHVVASFLDDPIENLNNIEVSRHSSHDTTSLSVGSNETKRVGELNGKIVVIWSIDLDIQCSKEIENPVLSIVANILIDKSYLSFDILNSSSQNNDFISEKVLSSGSILSENIFENLTVDRKLCNPSLYMSAAQVSSVSTTPSGLQIYTKDNGDSFQYSQMKMNKQNARKLISCLSGIDLQMKFMYPLVCIDVFFDNASTTKSLVIYEITLSVTDGTITPMQSNLLPLTFFHDDKLTLLFRHNHSSLFSTNSSISGTPVRASIIYGDQQISSSHRIEIEFKSYLSYTLANKLSQPERPLSTKNRPASIKQHSGTGQNISIEILLPDKIVMGQEFFIELAITNVSNKIMDLTALILTPFQKHGQGRRKENRSSFANKELPNRPNRLDMILSDEELYQYHTSGLSSYLARAILVLKSEYPIGTLTPGALSSVRLSMLGLRSGIHALPGVRLNEIRNGLVMETYDLPKVYITEG